MAEPIIELSDNLPDPDKMFEEAVMAAMPPQDEGITEPQESAEPEAAPEDEGQPQERPRNEKGQFVSKQEEEPEAQVEAEGDDSEQAAIQRVLEKLGDDPQKLAQAYRELERRAGMQGQELGELRKAFEERFSSLESKLDDEWDEDEDEPFVPRSQIVELAEDGQFQQAASLALQAQDGHTYQRIMRQWYDEDPFSAGNFHTQAMLYQQQQAYEAKIAELAAPVQRQTTQTQFNQAFQNVSNKYADFMDVVGPRLEDLVKGNPEVAAALTQGDQKAKERVLENLYAIAAFQAGTTRQQAAEQIDTQAAQEEQAAKLAATVASASTSNPNVSEPKEGKDILADYFAQDQRSIASGWETI